MKHFLQSKTWFLPLLVLPTVFFILCSNCNPTEIKYKKVPLKMDATCLWLQNPENLADSAQYHRRLYQYRDTMLPLKRYDDVAKSLIAYYNACFAKGEYFIVNAMIPCKDFLKEYEKVTDELLVNQLNFVIGNACLEADMSEQGNPYLEKVHAISNDYTSKQDEGNALLDRSYHYMMNNKLDSAEYLSLVALEAFESLKDTMSLSSCYASLYNIYDILQAKTLAKEALDKQYIWAKLSKEKREICGNLHNQNMYYEKRKDTLNAIRTSEEGKRIIEEDKDSDPYVKAKMYKIYASALMLKKQYELAKHYIDTLAFMATKYNQSDIETDYNYMQIKYEITTQGFITNPDKLVKFMRPIKLPKRLVLFNRWLAKDALYRKNYALAYQYKVAEYNNKDSIATEEMQGRIFELEKKYKTTQKEVEIKQQQTELWYKDGFIVFLIIGLGALFYLYYILNKQKNIIAQQADRLSTLIKELHHRVKNNLQIVSSLLNIQSDEVQDEAMRRSINEGKLRVDAMSIIHQRLYLTDDIAELNLEEFVNDLIQHLAYSYGYQANDYTLHLSIKPEMYNVDDAIPIGLMLNEVLTNAFKYAFPNNPNPELWVAISNESGLKINVRDNGSTAPQIALQGTGFGTKLIASLSYQLNASASTHYDNGYSFTLTANP